MGRPEWTTPEEKAWLEKRIPDFVEAQENHNAKSFFVGTHDEWFHRFELEPPTAEEIAAASGNVEKATSVKKKKQKARVKEWFYNHTRSATSHRVLNLAKRKTGYLHPYQAYMTMYKPRVMPILKERYADYLRGLEAGSTPMSELAFNAKTARELLQGEPQDVHDAIKAYRDSKRRRASKNLLTSVLKEATPDGEDDAGEGDDDVEQEEGGAKELLADLLKNIDSLPATLQDTLNRLNDLTGWVGCIVLAGPHPRTGTMTTIAAEVGSTQSEDLKFSELSPKDWETIQNSVGAFADMCFPSRVEKALTAVMQKMRETAGETNENEEASQKPKRKLQRDRNDKVKRVRDRQHTSTKDDVPTAKQRDRSAGSVSSESAASNGGGVAAPTAQDPPAQVAEAPAGANPAQLGSGAVPTGPAPAPKPNAERPSPSESSDESSDDDRYHADPFNYEAQRLRNIEKNKSIMAALDLKHTDTILKKAPKGAANRSGNKANPSDSGSPSQPQNSERAAAPGENGSAGTSDGGIGNTAQETSTQTHISNDAPGHEQQCGTNAIPDKPDGGHQDVPTSTTDKESAQRGDATAPSSVAPGVSGEISPTDNNANQPSPVVDQAAQASSGQAEDRLAVATTDAPAWVLQAKAFLLSVSSDDRWVSAVREWLLLEKAMGYPGAEDSRLSPKNRPIQIRQWVRNHRRYETRPAISKVAQYGATCELWWATLQPTARLKTSDGKPSRKRLNADAWGHLRQGGSNGLFLVLMCVAWWIQVAGANSDDLRAALAMADDLAWVIAQLTPERGEARLQGEAQAEDASANEPQPKRRKIEPRQLRPRKSKSE